MIKKAMRFWSEETGLTALLIFVAVEMFLLFPLVRTGVFLRLVNAAVSSLLLLAGLLTITRHKLLRGASTVFVVVAIVARWLRVAGVPGLMAWDEVFSSLGLAGLTVVVLWAVYREGPVTAHRIRGAIVAYLLLAVFFAYVYGLIEYLSPGALRFVEGGSTVVMGEPPQWFLYFSVVTITTLGYGDITPIHPLARSVVMLEAVVGPLYLTILLARLVTLQIAAEKSGSGHDGPKRPSAPDKGSGKKLE